MIVGMAGKGIRGEGHGFMYGYGVASLPGSAGHVACTRFLFTLQPFNTIPTLVIAGISTTNCMIHAR